MTQAAAPLLCSTLTGAELSQAKKRKKALHLYAWHHFGGIQLFASLWAMAFQSPAVYRPVWLLYPSRSGRSVVLVAESCPSLRDPIDCGPPGSSVHGILQARTLE